MFSSPGRKRTTGPHARNRRAIATRRILGTIVSLIMAEGIAAAGAAGDTDQLTACACALFASDLSVRCDHSRAEIAAAIRREIRSHRGIGGCIGEVAAAYGEHPETAAPRMRWARSVIEDAYSSAGNPPAQVSWKTAS